MQMYWPIALVVLSNVFYHISSKQMPEKIHPMASLTITYIVGAILAALMYFVMNKDGNLLSEYRHLNWTSFVLGLAIVGLEFGFISMYKAGWNINSAQIISSAILAIALLVVGLFLYKEQITPNKVFGVIICLVGIYLMNSK